MGRKVASETTGSHLIGTDISPKAVLTAAAHGIATDKAVKTLRGQT